MTIRFSKKLNECNYCGDAFCKKCAWMEDFCSETCLNAWDEREARKLESVRKLANVIQEIQTAAQNS